MEHLAWTPCTHWDQTRDGSAAHETLAGTTSESEGVSQNLIFMEPSILYRVDVRASSPSKYLYSDTGLAYNRNPKDVYC